MREVYRYAVLDPRPGADNEKIFENPAGVIGIEVTVPALAARCLQNIDPQHTGGNAKSSAIEAALEACLPPEGVTLATVRADLDAIGAMAVMSLRKQQSADIISAMERIGQVAEADKFSVGGSWPGPKPINEFGGELAPLAAIAAAIGDFKVPVETRVSWMTRWIISGEEPEGYRTRVECERAEIARAISDGTIKAISLGMVAIVESPHRAAMEIGYRLAPVVVALNPEFRFQGGEPHRKFTVGQYAPGMVDLKKVQQELNRIEPGWGGSPTIIGSPQGNSSSLTIEEVARTVIIKGTTLCDITGPENIPPVEKGEIKTAVIDIYSPLSVKECDALQASCEKAGVQLMVRQTKLRFGRKTSADVEEDQSAPIFFWTERRTPSLCKCERVSGGFLRIGMTCRDCPHPEEPEKVWKSFED